MARSRFFLEHCMDRVLRRGDDLMDLRRYQTRAVEEILGDLCTDSNGTSVSSIILTSDWTAWSAVMPSRSAVRLRTCGAAPPCWSQTTAPSSASRLHLLPLGRVALQRKFAPTGGSRATGVARAPR